MRDEWFGHRDPITFEPTGDRTEFLRWDFILMDALEVVEGFMDPKSGLPIWELEDDNVFVYANRKINKFQAAIDEKTTGTAKKPYKPAPGEYFVPDMQTRSKDEDGNPRFQTFSEWIEKNAKT